MFEITWGAHTGGHLVAELFDDSPKKRRVEARLALAVVLPGNHREHHVELVADQVPREPHPVFGPAADDVDQVPDLPQSHRPHQHNVTVGFGSGNTESQLSKPTHHKFRSISVIRGRFA